MDPLHVSHQLTPEDFAPPSDTPRTDAALRQTAAKFTLGPQHVLIVELARQLERELEEARKDAERLGYLMTRHRSSLYRMVTGETYHGVLAGTDEYRTRMRAAIDTAMAPPAADRGK